MTVDIAEQLVRFHDAARLNMFFRARLISRGFQVETIDIVRVQHRPKAGVSGLYRVQGQDSRGQRFQHHYGLTTEKLKAQERHDTVPTSYAGIDVTVWRHPKDPRLPGLAMAADPDLLAALWPETFAGGPLTTRWKTYRPLRRAVLEVKNNEQTAFVKVLTPRRARRLTDIHRIVDPSALPCARLLGEPKAGILPLSPLVGRPLTDFLFHDDPAKLLAGLPARRWLDLLDELPAELLKLKPRPAWTDGLNAYVRSAAAAFPQLAGRIRRIRKHLRSNLPKTDRGPLVPTHGDFYEANVFLTETAGGELTICGLLDLDNVGPGHRVDDLACMLGHLEVLPSVHERYRKIRPLVDAWWDDFSHVVDPHALRLRAASVGLSLIAGARHAPEPKARQIAEQRLQQVEQILDRE